MVSRRHLELLRAIQMTNSVFYRLLLRKHFYELFSSIVNQKETEVIESCTNKYSCTCQERRCRLLLPTFHEMLPFHLGYCNRTRTLAGAATDK
jgi:redox-regulated HSP33 family molecular chaperone